ncbi:hypothetical protein NicSoilB11_17800 [Arthrobacter sp. NicSoilB11]|nr:hypothetical protein NicSoilB11_17800 [Arthrobacter sp. NicSoilB11]
MEGSLLDGLSAYELYIVLRKVSLGAGIPPLMLVPIINSPPHPQWAMTLAGLLVCLTGGCVIYFAQVSTMKENREVEAGYTTLPRAHMDVAQRNPYLGRVIRMTGAQYLERDDFKAIATRTKLEWRSARAGKVSL